MLIQNQPQPLSLFHKGDITTLYTKYKKIHIKINELMIKWKFVWEPFKILVWWNTWQNQHISKQNHNAKSVKLARTKLPKGHIVKWYQYVERASLIGEDSCSIVGKYYRYVSLLSVKRKKKIEQKFHTVKMIIQAIVVTLIISLYSTHNMFFIRQTSLHTTHVAYFPYIRLVCLFLKLYDLYILWDSYNTSVMSR